MITVKEVSNKNELKQFVKFPFQIYKNNPYWVPPIIKDEILSFDKEKNPAFKSADAHFLLAYREGKIVGRIAAIINWNEVNDQQLKKMRFGWFDVIDDIEVTKALLSEVEQIGLQNNLTFIEGPVGFSNLDKVGVLTEGFDVLGTMITTYNHAYYKVHLEQLGYRVEKSFQESNFSFSDVHPETFTKANDLIKKRYGLKTLTFKTTKEVMVYADRMFDLFNKAYRKLPTFVAINDIQKAYFKEKYISLINPEYIVFVEDSKQELIAFAIVMPSFSRALQKANGKLWPTGIFHLLKAKKKSKDVIFYLIGIDPEYQNKGVTAVIFSKYYEVFKRKGIQRCIRTPELDDNHAIHKIWKHFNPKIHKRRCTYRKDLT
ncbi:GNAT family N-acetyltransferase [Flavobacteriaceae bacterium F08102]|nr:GNAT family N-acetyltransferase [Flavobacteriaceae bacterium F08102]